MTRARSSFFASMLIALVFSLPMIIGASVFCGSSEPLPGLHAPYCPAEQTHAPAGTTKQTPDMDLARIISLNLIASLVLARFTKRLFSHLHQFPGLTLRHQRYFHTRPRPGPLSRLWGVPSLSASHDR